MTTEERELEEIAQVKKHLALQRKAQEEARGKQKGTAKTPMPLRPKPVAVQPTKAPAPSTKRVTTTTTIQDNKKNAPLQTRQLRNRPIQPPATAPPTSKLPPNKPISYTTTTTTIKQPRKPKPTTTLPLPNKKNIKPTQDENNSHRLNANKPKPITHEQRANQQSRWR